MKMKPCSKQSVFVIILCFSLMMLQMAAPSAGAADTGHSGQFNLISVGVGDADLITVRAVNAIKASDIIICRPGTEKAFSTYLKGKTLWKGAFREWRTYDRDCSSIKDKKARDKCRNDRAVCDALEKRIRVAVKQGKSVSVLGSGDLLLYGGPYRWYIKSLQDLNIRIIPGVSCLNAANAALGCDIMGGSQTHSAVMTTYREIDKMAPAHPTMIIFTMHTEFADIVKKLTTHYPLQTPIAIVFYAGYKKKETTVSGTLETILEKVRGIDFPFEHLVYVGDFLEKNK